MTLVLGHRGASAAARENTREAFALAIAMGADGVELDVHLTADGALAVHHDPDLADGRLLAEVTAADLPPHVPLLPAVLEVCAGRLVNVEIKDVEAPGAVAALLAGRRHMLVSSFVLATVDRVRALDPSIPTGLLTVEATPRAVEVAAERGHAALHPHHSSLTADLVDAAHAVGLAVNTWTVNDPDRIAELARWGVDAVITDVPDVALGVLGHH